MKFFRVDYRADLLDGRCFRPHTWIVLSDVETAEAASSSVIEDTREDARMWHNTDAIVSIHRVQEVTESDYYAHLRDVQRVIDTVAHDPGAIRREAARRGVLPTVVAEEYKQRAARLRLATEQPPVSV